MVRVIVKVRVMVSVMVGVRVYTDRPAKHVGTYSSVDASTHNRG